MPCGFDGIAFLWKQEIDHLITPRPGGNQIHCVEVKGAEAFLLLSIYMQCKGITENSTDYLHIQADNPWYNYYIFSKFRQF